MPRRRTPKRRGSALRAFLPKGPRLPRIRLPRAPATLPPLPARRPAPGVWIQGVAVPGGRSYDVYRPAGHRRTKAAPVVLLLHGCSQTAAEFADATRFTTVADRNGLLLVLPHQESRHHPQRCWRWYEAAHQQRGVGEPALLVGIVSRVLAEQARWRADPLRVYVAGLSAGGAMALTLAATYPDVFAAAGAHSAPAYRSAQNGGQALPAMGARTAVPPPVASARAMAPLVVVQGAADRVVSPRNGDRVAAQWLHHHAASGDPRMGRTSSHTGRTADGRAYERTRWYAAGGRRMLEHWQVAGLGHAWSGGRDGGSYSDPRGPRAATLMWGFFRLHRLAVAPAVVRSAGA